MKAVARALVVAVSCVSAPVPRAAEAPTPRLHWADASRKGVPFSKDPAVIRLGDRYLLYYSMPPATDPAAAPGWGIGIAESTDLVDWRKVGDLSPAGGCEAKGRAAPEAIVLSGTVHLFFQTYGNGPQDAICHAVSTDGIHFERDPTNPVFRPTGAWNSGRAIDAEVYPHGDRLLLWFATRDPGSKTQMLGVAAAPLDSDFSRDTWRQLGDGPVLSPTLPWERRCVEAPSVIRRGDSLWMFYAGGYNNEPQQIGVASSADGVAWARWSDEPFLPNGAPGTWNASEAGHPGIFADVDGRTYLFFQGNDDGGTTWFISAVEIGWKEGVPFIARNSATFPWQPAEEP